MSLIRVIIIHSERNSTSQIRIPPIPTEQTAVQTENQIEGLSDCDSLTADPAARIRPTEMIALALPPCHRVLQPSARDEGAPETRLLCVVVILL